MDALAAITLVIALWGAGLSTVVAISKRRVRLRVSADFGVGRLGKSRRHGFFIVTVVNVGERAVTVSEVWWEVNPEYSFTLALWRHSKGDDLPVQVEADEQVQILFDIDAASRNIAELSVAAIKVEAAGHHRDWRVEIADETREEAHEHVERLNEVLGDDDASTD